MSTNRGMVQVFGTTYRIVARADRHEVIRVLDDQLVGVFQHRPFLQVLRHEIERDLLLRVAREALRQARLAWLPARRNGSVRSSVWLTHVHTEWRWMLDGLSRTLSPRRLELRRF
jgi:hypothetical protein